ncbi:MAG: FtsQ-type POTRA domain-containing protein [Patescibacteria group bacterium]
MSYRKKYIKPKIKRLKPQKPFFKKTGFWGFIFFLFFMGFLWAFLFLPQIQVLKIEIRGSEKISIKKIEDFISFRVNKKVINLGLAAFYSQSILAVNSGQIEKELLNGFIGIKSAKIEKKFPGAITVKIEERKPFAVFCESEKCFYIDEQAVVFEKALNYEGFAILKKSDDKIKVDENIINITDKVSKSLKNNFQIGVKKVLVANPMVFKTSENWQAYFDLNSDIDYQIKKMEALLNDEIPEPQRKNLEYIYLQYQDRAYYR